MRGRKPTPDHLRLVTGAKRQGVYRNKPTATTNGDRPIMPPHLGPEAAREWERIAEPLYLAGYVTRLDSAVLGAFCAAYGRWEQAETALAQFPELTITTKAGNTVQSVLVGVANKAMADMVKIAAELGCTPVARARITATPPLPTSDPADRYL